MGISAATKQLPIFQQQIHHLKNFGLAENNLCGVSAVQAVKRLLPCSGLSCTKDRGGFKGLGPLKVHKGPTSKRAKL